jgi:CubicO group peptidase (beta-lactamase class C family)
LLDRWVKTGMSYGISAAVIDGDDVTFFNSGQRTTGDAAVDARTIYEIGSVTKVFTSLLLADMAARGEVGLDDPIDGLLPDGVKPPRRDERSITLRQLAQHTSGLPRLPGNFAPASETDPFADYTTEKLYAFLNGYTLPRAIGEKYEYSNLGMGLLGALLARRADTEYEALVETRICQPLGMESTTGELNDAVRARLAPGHHGARTVSCWTIPALPGCGQLRSSAAEMARFVRAHLEPDASPLSAAIRTCLDTNGAATTDIPKTKVTLGWHLTETAGGKVYWHNGGTGGYRSFIGFNPQKQRGVVVLANSPYSVDNLAMHLLDRANPLAPIKESVVVPPQVLQSYVGQYRLTILHQFDITLENGQLFARLTGQASLPLWAESPTKFFYREVDAQITFERDAEQRPQALVLHQFGADQRAARVAAKSD